ncbi:MAG TPA: cation-translocating P-type ATPase [Bacteroidota bacterium]|nr:cation-translocating P-type ATPase [Bacteroidota bacterium]
MIPQVKEHKTELFRLAAMALALVVSRSAVLTPFLPFDVVALAATLLGGFPMFREAYEAVRERRMTMELSMTIAVVATLVIGQFFTGLVITFFVIFAELLEHLTVSRGRSVIEKLIEFLPGTATVRRNDDEAEIPIDQLRPNDTVIIKPGTRIPVDGVVIRGNSFVDQSSITGESLPVEKIEGAEVFAGTMNKAGILEVEAHRVSKETMFGKIIEVIEKAERSKAPIQKVADVLSARLVYFALGGATLTIIVTHNIVSAIAALIVAGACGVAAGTPLAILAGIGRTAKEAIIVKGGVYLEVLSTVDTIVLDKTGTLTLGKPQVIDIHSFDSVSIQEVLRLAASVEQHSEHPLAKAVLEKAGADQIPIAKYSDMRYLPGQGLVCRVEGTEILLGNIALMEARMIRLDSSVNTYVAARKERGETCILLARQGVAVGAISIADTIRSEARQSVEEMKRLGCRVVLLTGDSWAVARAIGETLHVDEVFGEMMPEQKLEKIRALKSGGRIVAMVGDGINDAPALIEANVGIAMGTGTAIALESADMALATDNLLKIVEALKISKQSLRVIMFNFWGTIIVDIAGVSLAFFQLLTPLGAALIHVGSELGFILNSARLLRK